MATPAHCAFCFETLSAQFDKRQPLSLAQVEDLWDEYEAAKSKDEDATKAGASQDSDANGAPDQEDDEMTDAETEPEEPARPAAISRLLKRKTGSETSSNSSLPSTRSSGSSSSSKGSATPASSKTSLSSSSGRTRPREEYPLFVTWNTHSARTGEKSLRGCIGTFGAQELEHGLKSYALTSAFEDTRFAPIPSTLLPSLSVHVTLLTNFSSPTRDALDWTLGTHGIRISFTLGGRRYGATYLPSVAEEQGWTKEETLASLMRKAGWMGGGSGWAKAWKDGRGELVRYEGRAVGLGYGEWRGWREWVEEGNKAAS
ncbi:hypothetical protein WHR41_04255 [Cladosporium halotolerans]|uniref:AMMECR1 domain-containing protein n=1 Tax=Cladosporium halotolerans TaxID=1052096 RepID=A0AB34KTP7_9PEZI